MLIGGVWTLLVGLYLRVPETLWLVIVGGDRGEAMFALIWTGIPVLPGVIMLVAGVGMFLWSSRSPLG